MKKLPTILKIIILLPLLLLVIPADGIIFALANSCASCSSFSQYLTSSFSLFNAVLISLTGLIVYFREKQHN